MNARTLLAAAALATLFPVTAIAGGTLSLFPVSGGTYQSECNFVEPAGAGAREVAVVLLSGSDGGYVGVDTFGIGHEGINWVALGITSPHALLGSFDGLQVSFGACLAPPIVVATLTYYSPGASPCGEISITPMGSTGSWGNILVACDLSYTGVQAGALTVNGVFDMPPGAPDPYCFCPAVSTEPSTWGRVKSLYR